MARSQVHRAGQTHMGRPLASLTLADDERSELRGWARRPTTVQAHALRARIALDRESTYL